jgi:single-strand DNA-binding protein
MSKDLNNLNIIGNLVADPTISYTTAGVTMVKFAIANNNTYLQDGRRVDEVSFFDCVSFGKQADVLAQYCKKGQRLAISGRIKQDRWEDKDGGKRSKTVIRVGDFQFLSMGTGKGGSIGSDDINGEICE